MYNMKIKIEKTLLGRPTWAEIDLNAVTNNVKEFKKAIGPEVELLISAKANGYGHGFLPIIKEIDKLNIYGYATGNIYEAIEMRKAGIVKPIQLFAHNLPETAELLVKYDLMPSFVNPGDADSFLNVLGNEVPLKVWIKCDTGLGRLGLWPEEVLPCLEYIKKNTPYIIEGLYTHIGPVDNLNSYSNIGISSSKDSSNIDKTNDNDKQIELFKKIVKETKDAGFKIPRYQFASTFACQAYPSSWFNTVCIGTGLFYNQKPQNPEINLDLENCLKSIRSKLISVKLHKKGTKTLKTIHKRDSVLGVVPFGMGDGFSTNNVGGEVLFNGTRCKIRDVCLEHTVIDLTDVQNPKIGGVVTFLGTDKTEEITIKEIYERLGIAPIEFICTLNLSSFPYIYMKDGKISEVSIVPDNTN